ncbi:MAG: hypothetical protein ACON4N_10290 [Myxococcota bacterium]
MTDSSSAPVSYALGEAVTLPLPGRWHVGRAADGQTCWVRVPASDDADEGPDAVQAMHDKMVEGRGRPRVHGFDRQRGWLALHTIHAAPISVLLENRREPNFVMSPATILDLGVQLAEILVASHERGRPHGYLSPDQVWVTEEGRVLVWGFSAPDQMAPDVWLSPEAARGRRASGDADQWAIGAILAALITGREPWRGAEPRSEARLGDTSHLSGPVIAQWKPLGRLLTRMLANESRERFPSMHPVRQALKALSERVPQESTLGEIGAAACGLFVLPSAPAAEASDASVPEVDAASESAMDIPEPVVPSLGPEFDMAVPSEDEPETVVSQQMAPLQVDIPEDEGPATEIIQWDDEEDAMGEVPPTSTPVASMAETPVPAAPTMPEPSIVGAVPVAHEPYYDTVVPVGPAFAPPNAGVAAIEAQTDDTFEGEPSRPFGDGVAAVGAPVVSVAVAEEPGPATLDIPVGVPGPAADAHAPAGVMVNSELDELPTQAPIEEAKTSVPEDVPDDAALQQARMRALGLMGVMGLLLLVWAGLQVFG